MTDKCKFVNYTTKETSTKIIPGHGTTYVADIFRFSDDEKIEIFEKVIELNNWKKTDDIRAYDNRYSIGKVIYKDGKLSVESMLEDCF